MSEPVIAPVSGWSVTCAACRRRGPADGNIRTSVELAQVAGWVAVEIKGAMFTLCPACAATLQRQWGEAHP